MTASSAPRLRTANLTKRFYQARLGRVTEVLDGIDLAVAAGEFVALLGPSGCGKTTLLHIVDGLVRPTRGQVFVDGTAVSGPGRDRAVVFQEPALLPWRTTGGNVAYGLECLGVARRERFARAQAAVELVGLEEFAHHYPHELSGGMQQRVNLARALAVDPAILLMDEPFAALDAQTREAMQMELLGIWERTRKTVLFVTHQIAEAIFLADRVVVLTPRPARIRATIAVELPRPRGPETRRMAWLRDCEDYTRELLRDGTGR